MRYQNISNTGLKAAAICLGTGGMGSSTDRETSFRMLDAYLDAGGNFIDTAKIYADWLPDVERSISEKTIGAWMMARQNRSKVILATKGAHPELSSMNVSRMSRAEIVSDLDASLKSLGTDSIDIYWLHRDDRNRPVEDILSTLGDQVKAGKIRHFGASNWQVDRLKAAQNWASQNHVPGFVGNQLFWNIGLPDPERIPDKTLAFMDGETMQYHIESGLAVVAYTSQANGYFTRRANGIAVSDNLRSVYHLPENESRLERIRTLSHQTGLTASQIGLAYINSQLFPAFPIVGCRTMDQLEDSLTAADVALTAEQVRYLVSD